MCLGIGSCGHCSMLANCIEHFFINFIHPDPDPAESCFLNHILKLPVVHVISIIKTATRFAHQVVY